MDSQLKGLILNHTLKSYTIAPIENNNVLEVTMKFYGGYKYKSPSKRRQDRLRKERFLAKFKRDPLLVPIPFLVFCPWVGLYLLLFLCKCLLLILLACWHLYLSDNPVKHKISPLYDLFNTIYIFTSCLIDLQLRSDLKFELSGFYSWACHMIACTLNWLASTQGASISNLWWEIHSRK